jgi:predicted RND superfamily exporter protein
MLFEKIADGVNRHYKKIIVFWVVALLLAVPAMLQLGSVMEYQMDLGSGDDQESVRAQRIIEQNFQRSVANGTIMVLLQADNMTDPFMRNYVLELQQRILSSPDVTNLEGVSSLYTFAEEIIIQAVLQLGPTIYSTEQQVNDSAFMLWGIPSMHVMLWNIHQDDAQAYEASSAMLEDALRDMDPANATMVRGYYGAFINAWNATSGTDPELRAVEAAGNAAPEYIDGLPLPVEQKSS